MSFSEIHSVIHICDNTKSFSYNTSVIWHVILNCLCYATIAKDHNGEKLYTGMSFLCYPWHLGSMPWYLLSLKFISILYVFCLK